LTSCKPYANIGLYKNKNKQDKNMTSISVHETLGEAQIIPVSTEVLDYAAAQQRYLQEAEAPGLSEPEIQAKLDTAQLLGELAAKHAEPTRTDLDARVQQYLGNEKPTSR
jgi:hypothetical protein